MDESFVEMYSEEAKELGQKRFTLTKNPTKEEIKKFDIVESAVEKFLFKIRSSGDAEDIAVLQIEQFVGGPSRKDELLKFIEDSNRIPSGNKK